MVSCPVIVVVMLESRVVRCVHCDEDVARPPDDGRKDARNMLRIN
jgi:hypothetical protein